MTAILLITGTVLMVLGTGWHWRLLHMNLSELYREAKAKRLPQVARWQRGLAWLGTGLFVLSLWRQCSGL